MKTWTTGSTAADAAGFQIIHCGHPTALWPYYIQPPDGFGDHHMAIAPNNKAFQYLADAQAAARLLHCGDLVMGGPLKRCCLVPGSALWDHRRIMDAWAAIRHDRLMRAGRRKSKVAP